jgi:hypothetical protein
LLSLTAQFVRKRFCPLCALTGGQQLRLYVCSDAGRNPESDDQRAEESSDENPCAKDRAVNHG